MEKRVNPPAKSIAWEEARAQDGLLQAIVERLVEEYQPAKVFSYGSHAYGQPRIDSDVDLLVIKETEQERWDRRREVVRILKPVAGKTELDVRVLTPSELDLELRDGNHFYQEVLYRGTLLYGDEEVYPMGEDSTPYAKAWLSVALEDMQAAEMILDGEGAPNVAGMLIQQSLGKYLKAYMMFRGWRLQRTHNLNELLAEAVRHDSTLGQYDEVCEEITKYYVDDRYPESRRELTHSEVEEALEAVRPMIDRILETSP